MLVEEVAKLKPIDRLMYWMRERHQIYMKRRAGKPAPWTNDWILQSFFFTNPYRENDKVTAWFRKHVRDPMKDDSGVFFATVAFRWFSWIPTGELLLGGKYMSKPKWNDSWPRDNLLVNWDPLQAVSRLHATHNDGNKVFTGAFVISNGCSPKPKINRVCEDYIGTIWKHREELVDELKRGAYEGKMGMQDVHELLSDFPGFGGSGFMAYEVVCDLRYTWVLRNAPDKTTWCNTGPGARRGMNRLMERKLEGPISKKDWAKESRDLLAYAQRKLKGMPPLEMREIEHSLCEWDKYERARMGDGHMKRKYNATGT